MQDTTRPSGPICSECGLVITDLQDIKYTLSPEGDVTATFHTPEFHMELEASEHTGTNHEDCGACYEATGEGLY